MDKYIFFTSTICNMGGAHQYISNKVRRLQDKGVETYVFSFTNGDVYIQNLKPFCKYINPLFRLSPSNYSKKNVKKVIDFCLNCIGDTNCKICIESTVVLQSEWAELLAKEIHCQHILINLQERHQYSDKEMNYLKFKYSRKELFGINAKSMSLIFGSNYKKNYDDFIYAECGNVVQDIESDLVHNLPKADYYIGSIGRLSKPYVKPMTISLREYFAKHIEKKYVLVYVGGGEKDVQNEIMSFFSNCPNVKVYITGYIFPIPLMLVKKMNCFISSAGSSRESMSHNIPTITMSAEDCKPIGILNYTTTQTLYSDKDVVYPLEYYLEQILERNFCKTTQTLGMECQKEKFDAKAEFERQMSLFQENFEKEYYPMDQLREVGLKSRVYRMLARILGPNVFNKLQMRAHCFKKK